MAATYLILSFSPSFSLSPSLSLFMCKVQQSCNTAGLIAFKKKKGLKNWVLENSPSRCIDCALSLFPSLGPSFRSLQRWAPALREMIYCALFIASHGHFSEMQLAGTTACGSCTQCFFLLLLPLFSSLCLALSLARSYRSLWDKIWAGVSGPTYFSLSLCVLHSSEMTIYRTYCCARVEMDIKTK